MSSGKKSEPVRQHYIPQFYLKRFCNEKGTFSVYDRLQCEHFTNCRPKNFELCGWICAYDKDTNVGCAHNPIFL